MENNQIASAQKLPLLALLALTTSGFIAIITETMPAGLLQQISEGLGVSQSYAGQFITTYALGSVLAAIPIITLTRNWNRKPLLLLAVSGFFIFNLCTYLIQDYYILLGIRFLAGISAGIIWGMITGYTVRLVTPSIVGKSLAIVGVGQPIALCLGVPLATWLGQLIGWNTIFLLAAGLSLLLVFWILFLVPDVAITTKTASIPFKAVLSNRTILKILALTLLWILAHNLLYTYISPFVESHGLEENLDILLFLFGISSIIGIWLTGRFIDSYLKQITIIHLLIFVSAGVLMSFGHLHPVCIYIGVILWGYSFGGAPIMLQKDLADQAKENVDIANSMFVTMFNSAIALAGLIGGLLLNSFGVGYILVAFISVALITLGVLLTKKSTIS